jgi:hypothetical protein
MNKTNFPNISKLKFRNKTVFGLFTVTVTNSVAVFLVRTCFQNGFLNLVSSIWKRGSGAGGALSTTHDVVTGYHIISITRACNVFKECGCVGQ